MLHLTRQTLLMKKINLSIPKPCHENWEAMTASEKGKFCSSCQKTVVDFTEMSDRQIAEFFKKPPSSVCGRIYNDQLHRDIVLPGKRIPWIKYFFQFTWPAFVFFLKSCGLKESTTGKTKVEIKSSSSQSEYPIGIVGMLIPQIVGADTINSRKQETSEVSITKGEMVGVISVATLTDTVAASIDTLVEIEPLRDAVDSTIYPEPDTATRIVLGGISVCMFKPINHGKDTVEVKTLLSYKDINFKVYPNPVRAGSSLMLSFESPGDFPERIQVVSSSGQLISEVKQNEKELVTVANIRIPSGVSAGIYFLQVIAKNAQEVKTTKIIVTK
jgi:hypothetical protein